jgi:hypothetical protein
MWGTGPWLTFPDRIDKFHFRDEGHHVSLVKIEASFTIARLGLQGTLIFSIFCLLSILGIVYSPLILKRDIIEGWQIVSIVFLMVAAVVFFGAFIFDRALKLSARRDRIEAEASTSSTMPAAPARLSASVGDGPGRGSSSPEVAAKTVDRWVA